MRAYVMPLALVRNIRHLNPNIETLSANKTLIPTDPQIQLLDPGSNIREVEMPDPNDCEGQMFFIENTTSDVGILRLYDSDHLNVLVEIKKQRRATLIPAGGDWYCASSGGGGEKFETTITSWTASGSLYMSTITHGLGVQYVSSVNCIDTTTNEIVQPQSIKLTGSNTLEIWMPDNTVNMHVVITA